ncbi:MAG: RelA/SpoT family protein [Parvibaculales bacterium]
MLTPSELADNIASYEPKLNRKLLEGAYEYAQRMHAKQKRASGEPYFYHPVQVADILIGLKLDSASIITALLHDTLEDTDASFEEISKLFGEEIARLVNGVTKLTRLELASEESRQAENFRKLLLATAHDIRVLLVKLADRLHNMRTLNHISSLEKRERIARETMEIYAPLAGRMGIQRFRDELEDLAFQELNPEARNMILERFTSLSQHNASLTDKVTSEIATLMKENNIKAEIIGRQKKPFSIWRKMERKSIALEQLSDIFGFRIIVDDEADCYRALGAIHRKWRHVAGRYKDYISTPKRNGYQSIHTTVVGPSSQRVEMQIRSKKMHEIAENGIAAHWYYKENSKSDAIDWSASALSEIEPFRWIQELIEQMTVGDNAEEFLENTKLELFHDQVFCFTPKGRLIALPMGAMVLDFAYAVHTDVGDSCVGVRVNGRAVPLRTKLENGDEVEIIRSEAQHPMPSWEQLVVTGKARASIRRSLRERRDKDYQVLGKEILRSVFSANGRRFEENIAERALVPFEKESLEELYATIGSGHLSGNEVLSQVYPQKGQRNKISSALRALSRKRKKKKENTPIPIAGLEPGMGVCFAKGAFPLPGDQIIGIVMPGQGMEIHPLQSPHLGQFDKQQERWVALSWEKSQKEMFFPTRLQLCIANKIGALGVVATLIADYEANIINLELRQRDEDFYDLQLDIEVHDLQHVSRLLAALRGLSLISKAERVLVEEDK